MSGKMQRLTKEQYLELIENLAKDVISTAISENEFEVFGEGIKTPLQQKITDLARHLRYKHDHHDGCLCSDREDPRKTGLKNGLRQLTIEQLDRVINYTGEMVTDSVNYEDGKFCPLGIALGLDKIISEPTHEKVYNALIDLGYKVYNTRGIIGEFYTTNRKEDLITAAKEVLAEKQNG